MLNGRLALSACMVAVFAAGALLAFSYGPAARTAPLLVCLPGLALALAQLVVELLAKTPASAASGGKATLVMFVWLTAFVVGVVVLGLLVASVAVTAAFLRWHQRERYHVAVAWGLSLGVLVWLVFERLLGAPLFPGLLAPVIGF